MILTFYKYQGTGNDFIIIDNRQLLFDKNNTKRIKMLCDRRFGIGADGLILLDNHETLDFKMVYFNSDGNESSMCGNGGRCIVAFANLLGIVESKASFMAIDGRHEAIIEDGLVRLQMQDVSTTEKYEKHVFLNTGSPHHVELVDDLDQLNVKKIGSEIRYGKPYYKKGSNVNFVSKNSNDNFSVRTYERGVEDETLSCGTGVTAVALAMHAIGKTASNFVTLQTPGGELSVTFKENNEGYNDIWLIGPANMIFKGEMTW
ncbi:diaminopimelate epimerase [Hanstruepera ponticola]|uniref:diaminopimelate epimerase n=1 Tax=Hanstruepera ponticola TaxID=2042995 RepID=UPI001783FC54|nr:diaminopimelate epimerase [Hanstruepera ponticola]